MKSILFASKRRVVNICKPNIRYKQIHIKQQAQVIYIKCVLGESMPGEPMALKLIFKVNGKLKFLHRKNKILTQTELCRMLCNALIQPHFDYACLAWYENLNE